ncbi:uncharacterized protein Z520_00672 [Fonsecaea multimorphosa CBS 102226]|uniref:Uncharacterized protein n=1 Tax=Fonsecaea multimorphosa CBS 102226 TaxID=1442371 RepID=A0A0D2KKI8_9EURO|nr:uncharacterized protein Z520_00672 [Fonsecaea multimorphosa CBS 102226]KIY03980.1 hypothetical protein Z520_00672 [Fonsecaea multimorphosa CBS 102226]OAL31820.1 hypothetical protein AYO22_00690 [Fonsecaea multimorphosa]
MSDYVDPVFFEIVARDEAFRCGVQDFISHHTPAALTPFERGALHNFVFSYYGTSQNLQSQRLILTLHDMYNLQGLMDTAVLDNIRVNIHTHDTMGSALSSVPYSSIPGQPAALPMAHGNQIFHGTQPGPVIAATPHPGVQPSASTNSLLRCHPANLEHTITIAHREKGWAFECDACGHGIVYRGEFARHMKDGLGRAGFKVVRAAPDEEPVWYGIDAAGNEYMGRLLARVDDEDKKPQRIGSPCGPLLAASRRQKQMDDAN